MKIYKLQDFSLKLSVRTPMGIKLARTSQRKQNLFVF